jgi:carbonic anhydrase
MEAYKKLLLGNRAWVRERLAAQADFFQKSAYDQRPEFMWIGCSDSRVPAEDVTGAEPGELFVHRNIANLVIHTDFNMLSVLQYAIEGVSNAMRRQDLGLINKWLRHIKDVYRLHHRELETIDDAQKRFDRLVELNVVEQVQNLAETSIVQKAWQAENRPVIHGWVYDLRTGYVNEIASMRPGANIDDIYRFELPALEGSEEAGR